MTRAVLAWVVAAVSIGVFVAIPLLDPASDPSAVIFFGAATTTSALVGALLITRAPHNRIGPLMLASGAVLAFALGLSEYALLGATKTPPWPGIGVLSAVADSCFVVPIVVLMIVVPLIFPDGQFLSPRWRWLIPLVVVALAAQTLQNFIAPDQAGPAGVGGFAGIPALAPIAPALGGFSSATSVIGFGAGVAAMAIRYRDGSRVQRQQLKWLLAVAALAAIFFPLAFTVPVTSLSELFFILGVLTLTALPIAIAVAILRYHLFEIDRIISRTIAYVVITAVLVTAYAVLVILIQRPLGDLAGQNTISVALSTLIVAAMFQPLRRRVQAVVDRSFDRARYDAEATVAAFSDRLRDEVDLAVVTADLASTTGRALSPSTTGIWLRGTGR